MRYEDCDRGAGLDGSARPAELNPGDVKHFPLANGEFCAFEDLDALTQLDSVVINGVGGWGLLARRTNFGVGEILVLLRREEGVDCGLRWLRPEEHRRSV